MRIINPVAKYLNLNPSGPKGTKLNITRELITPPKHKSGFKINPDVKLDTSQVEDRRVVKPKTDFDKAVRKKALEKADEEIRGLDKRLPRKGPKITGRARRTNTG